MITHQDKLLKYFKTTASATVIAAVSSSIYLPAIAQSNDDEIIVTATRRESTLKDVPFNISAVTGDEIEKIGVTDLAEIADWVPGLHIVNVGGREQDTIVVRGINADGLGFLGSNGTVATYIGEIPFFVDLKLNDMKQVEVLLGPQGTLYGAGTMSGAIRYIPNKPDFEAGSLTVRADLYDYSEGDDISTDVGFTANLPISDSFALRASVDYLQDEGYIDYIGVVREIGVSNPDPAPEDRDANLEVVEDANTEETLSIRVAARWQPLDWLDATLTYYGQFQEVESRSNNSFVDGRSIPLGPDFELSGRYESAQRVLEPNERDDQLVALEVVADLGFAELTSATGYSRFDQQGNRDQTELLVGLGYSYEAFPSFTAITEEQTFSEVFNQEIRLVSKGDGPVQWIIGAFYNRLDVDSFSHEFVPQFPLAIDVGRTDFLEFDAFSRSQNIEQAVYGEVSLDFTDRWQVTLGGRFFEFDIQSVSDSVVVLFEDDPAAHVVSTLDSSSRLAFDPVNDASDTGTLFKINTSYAVTDDVNIYATVSEGFRLGGSNGIAPCPEVIPVGVQTLCALPNEQNFDPDMTTNHEIGFKGTFFEDRLSLNAALYYIDWEGILLEGSTVNGSLTFLQNGGTARSAGAEVSFDAKITDRFSLRGSYSFTDAELTSPAPDLFSGNANQSFLFNLTEANGSGSDGDRLPGSPEHQASLFADYVQELPSDRRVIYNLGVTYTSDILQRPGSIANGLTLDEYSVTNGSITLEDEKWDLTLYASNLFDEYAESSIVGTGFSVQEYFDEDGGSHIFRGLRPVPIPPRTIGIRGRYRF